MDRVQVVSRLVADLDQENGETVLDATRELLALGEYGSPVGAYPLKGAKAALKRGHLADAVVLLFHGLRVAESGTMVWAELLVNRAVACAHHGFYPDAIDAATTFLNRLPELEPAATAWVPHAHHALGFTHDRLRQYDQAIAHHRWALDAYQDPILKSNAGCDLAYSLALSGRPAEGLAVLIGVPVERLSGLSLVGYYGTLAIVRHCLGEHSEAVAAGERAEAHAAGNDELMAIPLAEVRYWMAQSAWHLGDRYRAAALALRAAVMADSHWNIHLRDAASDWLADIMNKGGIVGA